MSQSLCWTTRSHYSNSHTNSKCIQEEYLYHIAQTATSDYSQLSWPEHQSSTIDSRKQMANALQHLGSPWSSMKHGSQTKCASTRGYPIISHFRVQGIHALIFLSTSLFQEICKQIYHQHYFDSQQPKG